MKCISCGNEIPDVSTICPFCGSGNTPVKPIENTEEMEHTQVLEPLSQETIESTQAQVGVEGENTSLQTPVEDSPILYETPTEKPTLPEDLVVDANPLNQPELVKDGEKITNITPPPVQEKSKKKLFILIGSVVLVLLLLVVFFLYMALFKSAEKRVDAVLNGLFQTINVNQKIVEKASGNSKIKADLTMDNNNFKGILEEKYAYDFKQKLADVTFTLSEANYNNTSYIGSEPLKLQTYLYDKKAYILLPNFYENYIYNTIEDYDKIFDSIYKEDVQYQVIINGLKNALKASVKATSMKQTVEKKTIGKKAEQVNVITISLNEANQKRFINTLFNQLKNNTKFLEECSKLSDSTVDELKEKLDEAKEEIEYTKTNAQIEIYTSTFGTSFKGIKYIEGSQTLELYPIGKNYIIDGNLKEMSIYLKLNNTLKNTKTEEVQNLKVEFSANTKEDEHTIKGTVEIEGSLDKEPKVEKVNTKNSVEASHIPEADKERILNSIMQYGNFKSIFEKIGESMTIPSQSITPTVPQITIAENEAGV